jgi:hypothetical protein
MINGAAAAPKRATDINMMPRIDAKLDAGGMSLL